MDSDGTAESVVIKQKKTSSRITTRKKKMDINIPEPSIGQVDYYLEKWKELENYRLQEDALNKLFIELCPKNRDITDILWKASTLNNFYSTNIFSIYPVAKHIHKLDIDSRLEASNVGLFVDIQQVMIRGKKKNFYSFATKY